MKEIHTLRGLTDNLQNVNDWMQLNRQKMNAEKTELIYFGSRQQLVKSKESSIDFDSETITHSNCIKYLGTWLDENLNFRIHAKNICKKAIFNLYLI